MIYLKNVFSIKSILLSLASGALALLSTFLAPIFLGFCGAVFGPVCMGIGIAAAFCGAILISGVEAAIYMSITVIPLSIILAYMLKGKCAYRTAAIACTAACVLGEYVNMFAPYFVKGHDLAFAIDAYFSPIISQYNSLPVPQELNEMVKMLTTSMLANAAEILFAAMVMMGIAAGFLQTVLAYAVFGKKLALKKMAPFKTWQLPASFFWGSLIMLAATLIVSQMGLTYAGALSIVVAIIVVCPIALVGVCCIEFFIQIVPEGRGIRRIFIYGMSVMSFPTSLIIFIVAGIADKIFKLRKRVVVIKKK